MSEEAAAETAPDAPPAEGQHATRARRTRRRKAAVEQETPDTIAPAVEQVVQEVQERQPGEDPEEPKKQWATPPDPRGSWRIRLSPDEDAPYMYLLRNNRYQQVDIAFDEKPEEKHLQMLRDEGFRWRRDEGVWAKQLDRDAKWRTQADAEELFREIANDIRQARGMEPITSGAGGPPI